MPRGRRQRCRLISLKRQIKEWGFQKCDQENFLAHWYAFKLPVKTTLRNFPDGGSIWNPICTVNVQCLQFYSVPITMKIDFTQKGFKNRVKIKTHQLFSLPLVWHILQENIPCPEWLIFSAFSVASFSDPIYYLLSDEFMWEIMDISDRLT